MADFRTLDDIDVADKRVLVRCDLNVPVKDGRVTDATRIDRTALTLRELIDRGARVVVLSHFGRPDGKVVPGMSLKPLAAPLSAALSGLDSLLSIVQMPKGVPVGTLAIGQAGAANAGLLAAAMLAAWDADLAARLEAWRAAQTAAVAEAPDGA